MADKDPPITADATARTVRLQVAAARQDESGQGIARLPKSALPMHFWGLIALLANRLPNRQSLFQFAM